MPPMRSLLASLRPVEAASSVDCGRSSREHPDILVCAGNELPQHDIRSVRRFLHDPVGMKQFSCILAIAL